MSLTPLRRERSQSWLRRIWELRSRFAARLVFYFLGAAGITLVASAVAFAFFAYLDAKLQQINQENVPQMIAAFEVAQESAALAASLPLLTTATQSDFDDIVSRVTATQATFEDYVSMVAETETGSQRAAQLLTAAADMRSNIQETIGLVTKRFELLDEANRVVADAIRMRETARAELQLMLDDQLFFAMTGYQDLTDAQQASVMANAEEFDTYRHLAEIESALESGVELMTAAFNESDAARLIPLLERFEATKATFERYAMLVPAQLDIKDVFDMSTQLFRSGTSGDGAFALQQEILRIRNLEQQYILANSGIVRQLYEGTGALVSAASNDANMATHEAGDATTFAVYLLLGLNIAGIVGVVLIVWLVVLRKFVHRVDVLADRMHTMAEGDLEIDIPIDGNDEIAEMAEALEVFRGKSVEALRLNEVERLNERLASTNDKLESMNEELRTAQRQIVMREKLAAMGELTAGVAHEIKNPLNFMINFAQVSQELIAELIEEINMADAERDNELIEEIKNDLIENLERINNHGDRANSIVRDMLAMNRESSDWLPVNLNKTLSEHVRLAFHSARAADSSFQLEIIEELDENLTEIEALPNDIGRVFLNMFMNACYATNKRRVELKEGDSYEPHLIVRTKLHGEKVEVQIEDNGVGIEQAAIEKVFQPFFTTKPTDEGTGLGLALAADIVRAHGGEIGVTSEVMQFTRLSVRLPLAQSHENAEEAENA
ncbi:MAG: HAMP domain-containing protein [Gammaproteobacteria bacterium]|nr:HAMP domain-containing protein [Gammaproteobacteria bacterium]